MDRKNFLDKIKTMFSEVEDVAKEDLPAEVELKDITTEEGIVLRTSENGLVEGEKVSIVSTNEEGVEDVADAPEGEYVADGKAIVLDPDGVVVSISDIAEVEEPKEEIVEEEMSEEVAEEVKEEEVEMSEEVAPKWAESLISRLDALETANANLSESMSAIDGLSKVVSEIANLPADKEIKLSKSVSKKQEKLNSREERLRFLSKR